MEGSRFPGRPVAVRRDPLIEPKDHEMRIQVLYFADCPNHKLAVELVRQVAAELDLAIHVAEVEVSSGDDVAELCFLGSPTIQVEGLDVEPAARLRTDYGFSCRMYDGRGVPSRETMAEALAEARGLRGDVRTTDRSRAAGEVQP